MDEDCSSSDRNEQTPRTEATFQKVTPIATTHDQDVGTPCVDTDTGRSDAAPKTEGDRIQTTVSEVAPNQTEEHKNQSLLEGMQKITDRGCSSESNLHESISDAPLGNADANETFDDSHDLTKTSNGSKTSKIHHFKDSQKESQSTIAYALPLAKEGNSLNVYSQIESSSQNGLSSNLPCTTPLENKTRPEQQGIYSVTSGTGDGEADDNWSSQTVFSENSYLDRVAELDNLNDSLSESSDSACTDSFDELSVSSVLFPEDNSDNNHILANDIRTSSTDFDPLMLPAGGNYVSVWIQGLFRVYSLPQIQPLESVPTFHSQCDSGFPDEESTVHLMDATANLDSLHDNSSLSSSNLKTALHSRNKNDLSNSSRLYPREPCSPASEHLSSEFIRNSHSNLLSEQKTALAKHNKKDQTLSVHPEEYETPIEPPIIDLQTFEKNTSNCEIYLNPHNLERNNAATNYTQNYNSDQGILDGIASAEDNTTNDLTQAQSNNANGAKGKLKEYHARNTKICDESLSKVYNVSPSQLKRIKTTEERGRINPDKTSHQLRPRTSQNFAPDTPTLFPSSVVDIRSSSRFVSGINQDNASTSRTPLPITELSEHTLNTSSDTLSSRFDSQESNASSFKSRRKCRRCRHKKQRNGQSQYSRQYTNHQTENTNRTNSNTNRTDNKHEDHVWATASEATSKSQCIELPRFFRIEENNNVLQNITDEGNINNSSSGIAEQKIENSNTLYQETLKSEQPRLFLLDLPGKVAKGDNGAFQENKIKDGSNAVMSKDSVNLKVTGSVKDDDVMSKQFRLFLNVSQDRLPSEKYNAACAKYFKQTDEKNTLLTWEDEVNQMFVNDDENASVLTISKVEKKFEVANDEECNAFTLPDERKQREWEYSFPHKRNYQTDENYGKQCECPVCSGPARVSWINENSFTNLQNNLTNENGCHSMKLFPQIRKKNDSTADNNRDYNRNLVSNRKSLNGALQQLSEGQLMYGSKIGSEGKQYHSNTDHSGERSHNNHRHKSDDVFGEAKTDSNSSQPTNSAFQNISLNNAKTETDYAYYSESQKEEMQGYHHKGKCNKQKTEGGRKHCHNTDCLDCKKHNRTRRCKHNESSPSIHTNQKGDTDRLRKTSGTPSSKDRLHQGGNKKGYPLPEAQHNSSHEDTHDGWEEKHLELCDELVKLQRTQSSTKPNEHGATQETLWARTFSEASAYDTRKGSICCSLPESVSTSTTSEETTQHYCHRSQKQKHRKYNNEDANYASSSMQKNTNPESKKSFSDVLYGDSEERNEHGKQHSKENVRKLRDASTECKGNMPRNYSTRDLTYSNREMGKFQRCTKGYTHSSGTTKTKTNNKETASTPNQSVLTNNRTHDERTLVSSLRNRAGNCNKKRKTVVKKRIRFDEKAEVFYIRHENWVLRERDLIRHEFIQLTSCHNDAKGKEAPTNITKNNEKDKKCKQPQQRKSRRNRKAASMKKSDTSDDFGFASSRKKPRPRKDDSISDD